MNSPAVRAGVAGATRDRTWDVYKGWIVGGLIILVVLVVAGAVWLHFHPL